MADKKISQLTALLGANAVAADELVIVDVSDTTMSSSGTTKKIVLSEMQAAPLSAGTANGVAYLNGSKVLTTGSALTFDGSTLATNTASSAIANLFSSNAGGGEVGIGNGTYKALIGANFSSGTTYFGSAGNHPVLFLQNSSEQMRLTSTGLGIGTSSPQTKLHIEQATTCTARITSTGNSNLDLVATATSVEVGSPNGVNLLFKTSNLERARIDTSGNLGLGVTPSAWISAFKAMEFAAAGSVSAISDELTVGANAVYLTGTNWTYKATGFASQYRQSNSVHKWYTAPSGTAGDAISFTQALTLTANGNQLLGTTVEPTNRKSGNTYQAINSAVIEGTPYTSVSTSPVQLSRSSSVGLIAMITGFNTSGGAQGTWLVLVASGSAIVVSSSDATATVPTFSVSTGSLNMQTTTGTLSVVCQIFSA